MSTMYSVNRLCDINKIKPADIMYHVDRIFMASPSATSQPAKGDIVDTLINLETKIDEKIALRRLNTLEGKVDGLLAKLGVDSSKKTTDSKKKDSKKPVAKKPAPVLLPKVQPVSLPKKSIPAALLGKCFSKNLDLVCQVSPNAEPALLLAVIKSLQNAKSKCGFRLHYHSSVIKQDEAGYKFVSLMSAFDLKPDNTISRFVPDYDYVFTFLITNRLNNQEVDCCLNGMSHTSVAGDLNVAKFVWKLAGGSYCDECEYWGDSVNSVLEDKSSLNNVQAELKKNFKAGKGRFCDVAVALL